MSAQLLDGRLCSQTIKNKIKTTLQQSHIIQPGLAVILVGENPASQSYVGHKQRACEEVGIHSELHRLPINTTQKQLAELIQALNNDNKIHGILLQLPLPEHIEPNDLLELIDPKKDVDGFHPYNLGRLMQRRPLLRPCTPYGVMTLLNYFNIDLPGKHAVVVGASNIVGRPMALELLLAKCTTTVCHRFTQDLAHEVKQADLLIVATGKTGLVNSGWLKPGVIIVDVGFSRLSNGEISGDVNFESAKEIASWITPVPGGVGPMTVATLLANTCQAAGIQGCHPEPS